MEMTVENSIKFRVKKPQNSEYKAVYMDDDLIKARRNLMRKILANNPTWYNASNEVLDNILLYPYNGTYILTNEQNYDYLLQHTKVTIEEKEFRTVRAMMPFEYMNLTGKDFNWSVYGEDVNEAKQLAISYIQSFESFRDAGMGLYIYSGTKGSGKTMLSCCILNELAKRYYGAVKFVNSLDFLEMTKKGYSGEDDADVKALYKANVLVIDDIGVQMSREWVDTVFYRLVNDRYVNKLPTIYTSNIPVERLRMDDRIIDRIESTTYAVNLPEKNIRREKSQQQRNELLSKIK